MPTTIPLERALSAVEEACTVDPSATDEFRDQVQLTRSRVRAILRGYDARWSNQDYRVIDVEQVYRAPLVNPKTNKSSRSFKLAGRIDAIFETGGQTYVLDHKFTVQDFEAPDAPYWRHLLVEGQATHYMLLLHLNGISTDGAVWDAIHRPVSAPKLLSAADLKKTLASGDYFGYQITNGEALVLSSQAEFSRARESFPMYEARLTYDCTVARPGRYFARRPVPRLDSQVLEYAEDLWQHAKDMRAAKKVARLPLNSGACMTYNSPCQFLGICSKHDTPESDRWQRRERVHPELGEAGKSGALTHSRLRCFQTCRVKHRFQYEMRLERRDQEDKEAIYAGHLLHTGLEHWWQAHKSLQEAPDGRLP